jgi:hypothetical protein
MTPRQVVIVGFRDMMALDLAGPLEAFSSARGLGLKGIAKPGYKVTVAAIGSRSFRSEFRLQMTAAC